MNAPVAALNPRSHRRAPSTTSTGAHFHPGLPADRPIFGCVRFEDARILALIKPGSVNVRRAKVRSVSVRASPAGALPVSSPAAALSMLMFRSEPDEFRERAHPAQPAGARPKSVYIPDESA